MTNSTQAHGAIDTLLWLGAGAVALVLIALFWLGSGVVALLASFRRAPVAPPATRRLPNLPSQPAGL